MTLVTGSMRTASNVLALELLKQAGAQAQASGAAPAKVERNALGFAPSPLSSKASDAIMRIKELTSGRTVASSEVSSDIYNAGREMTAEERAAYNATYWAENIAPRDISDAEFLDDTMKELRNYIEQDDQDTILVRAVKEGTFKITRAEDTGEMNYRIINTPVYSGGGLIIGAESKVQTNDDVVNRLREQGVNHLFSSGSFANRVPYVVQYW